MAKTTRTLDLDAIDRLEEKVRRLIDVVGQMRSEQARLSGENARLERELDAAHERLTQAEGTAGEVTTLKEERELIRTRVADMLEQLEGLSL